MGNRHIFSDFPPLSSIDDDELDEEFHSLIADVKFIKAEMKASKNKDIEEIKAILADNMYNMKTENNLLRNEVRKLAGQLKDMTSSEAVKQ